MSDFDNDVEKGKTSRRLSLDSSSSELFSPQGDAEFNKAKSLHDAPSIAEDDALRSGSAPGAQTASSPQRMSDQNNLPPFGRGRPYPPNNLNADDYTVDYEGENDPLHPLNWSMKKKLVASIITGVFTFASAFGSAIFSAAIPVISTEYKVGDEVGELAVSLFVLGFATGPIIWAPWSELYGRKQPLMIASLLFGIFSIAVATGKDLQTVLICRFFNGFTGAAPLAVVGGVYADIWPQETRGIAVTAFAMCVFAGPVIAPPLGGFIVMNHHMGWRWCAYITAFLGFASCILITFFFKETYAPTVLVQKAAALRAETKNWAIHAKQDEEEINLRALLTKNLLRPLRMLVTEPILLLISIYMAFVYGVLYLLLTAYPIIFQEIRGWNPGVGGLPYLGIIVGELIGGLIIILGQPRYRRKLRGNNDVAIPEWRLPEGIAGGVAFAAGVFWLTWGGYMKSTPWIVPTLAGLPLGAGILMIFLQCLNYIIDCYVEFAASAIAANTFLRSIFGAVFPLFATYMFKGMGTQWAGTLLGCFAAAMVPVTLLFYSKGAGIRKKSSFAGSM